MSGVWDSQTNEISSCPCSQGTTQSVQSFISNDYFCESGNPNNKFELKLYTQDPLWDGKGCGTNELSKMLFSCWSTRFSTLQLLTTLS